MVATGLSRLLEVTAPVAAECKGAAVNIVAVTIAAVNIDSHGLWWIGYNQAVYFIISARRSGLFSCVFALIQIRPGGISLSLKRSIAVWYFQSGHLITSVSGLCLGNKNLPRDIPCYWP